MCFLTAPSSARAPHGMTTTMAPGEILGASARRAVARRARRAVARRRAAPLRSGEAAHRWPRLRRPSRPRLSAGRRLEAPLITHGRSLDRREASRRPSTTRATPHPRRYGVDHRQAPIRLVRLASATARRWLRRPRRLAQAPAGDCSATKRPSKQRLAAGDSSRIMHRKRISRSGRVACASRPSYSVSDEYSPARPSACTHPRVARGGQAGLGVSPDHGLSKPALAKLPSSRLAPWTRGNGTRLLGGFEPWQRPQLDSDLGVFPPNQIPNNPGVRRSRLVIGGGRAQRFSSARLESACQ